jgi:hypothetical protein
MLNNEFEKFLHEHLENSLGYLVDGDTRNLTFTLCANDENQPFIKSVKCELVN